MMICGIPKQTSRDIIKRYEKLGYLKRDGYIKSPSQRNKVIIYKVVNREEIMKTTQDRVYEEWQKMKRDRLTSTDTSTDTSTNGPSTSTSDPSDLKIVPSDPSDPSGKSVLVVPKELEELIEKSQSDRIRKEKLKLLDCLCKNGNSNKTEALWEELFPNK